MDTKTYYRHNNSGEIYYIGKDQKSKKNLINAKTYSEYFLPGYFRDKELKEYFTQIPFYSEKFEVLKTTKENFINVGTVIKGKSLQLLINANIKSVRRTEDGAVFLANNTKHITKSGHGPFYITHLWYNTALKTISVGGHYKKDDDYFSCNICSLEDLEIKQPD